MDTPPGTLWLWIISCVFLLLAVFTVLSLARSRPSPGAPETGWKGFWYRNPEDPALFVPKRWGIGWTVNFGNRWAWLYVIVIALLTVGPFLFVSVTLRHLLAIPSH
jgi:uncharacterized membrane protein